MPKDRKEYHLPSTQEQDFDNLQWCRSVHTDPSWTFIPTPSRIIHPGTSENALLTQSLGNERCIRGIRTYVHRPNSQSTAPQRLSDDEKEKVQVQMLFSLGSGVDGISSWCHGGFIGTMLDEATGHLASEVFGRYNIVTAGLNVRYLKRLGTPRVVLCRAWIASGGPRVRSAENGVGSSLEGRKREQRGEKARDEKTNRKRKVVIEGTVEDGLGVVFASAQAIFVRLDSKI